MTYELYWVSGSPNSWRAMLALELKGVPYESRRLDPSKGELKSPEYMKLNPRGKVPILKDGDFVVSESHAILAYLERKHPTPALFGTTHEETGRVWQRVFEAMNYATDDVLDGVVRPIIFGRAEEQGDEIKRSAEKAHDALQWVEGVLAQSPYLASDKISAADVAYLPIVQVLARVGKTDAAAQLGLGFDDLAQSYPNTLEWLRRIEALPEYDRAYPPHWRNT